MEQKRVLTECHAENDIIFTEQTERRRDGLELYEQSVNMTTGHQSIVDWKKKDSKKNDAYSANADGVTIFIQNVKIAADHVQRMNRVFDATKLETEVDELVAGHCPVPVRLIIDGALDTSINSIRQFAGYLRQSETGIENDHEFAVVCLGDDRVDEDGLTVGTGHAVDVCERLPMLIGIRQPVDLVHVQFRHGGDVLEPGDDFGDGELAGEGVGGVPVWSSTNSARRFNAQSRARAPQAQVVKVEERVCSMEVI